MLGASGRLVQANPLVPSAAGSRWRPLAALSVQASAMGDWKDNLVVDQSRIMQVCAVVGQARRGRGPWWRVRDSTSPYDPTHPPTHQLARSAKRVAVLGIKPEEKVGCGGGRRLHAAWQCTLQLAAAAAHWRELPCSC